MLSIFPMSSANANQFEFGLGIKYWTDFNVCNLVLHHQEPNQIKSNPEFLLHRKDRLLVLGILEMIVFSGLAKENI